MRFYYASKVVKCCNNININFTDNFDYAPIIKFFYINDYSIPLILNAYKMTDHYRSSVF